MPGRFAGHVITTSVFNLLLGFINIATGVLAARLLGPAGRGELAVIQLWPTFIASLAALGLPQALVYFAAQDSNESGKQLMSALLAAILSSIPFCIAGVFLMPVLLSGQHESVVGWSQVYLLYVPISLVLSMPFHILRGLGEISRWNVLRMVPSVAWLGVLLAAWIYKWSRPYEITDGYLVLLLIMVPLVFLTAIRKVQPPFSPELSKIRNLVVYGLPCLGSSVLQLVNPRVTQMVLVMFVPTHSLGLFIVSLAWGGASMVFLNALASVIVPRVGSQKTQSEKVSVLCKGVHLAGILSLVSGIIVFGVTPWVFPLLFGDQYASSVGVACIMVAWGVLGGFKLVLEEGLRGLGRPTYPIASEFVATVVNVVALLFLLTPLGILGAGLASVTGNLCAVIILLLSTVKVAGIPVFALLLPSRGEIRSSIRVALRILGRKR